MRKYSMSTIREVLYQHIKGNSQRQIARSFDLSRDTVRKYIELTTPENLTALTDDYQLNEIEIKVEEKLYENRAKQKVSAMEILVKYNEEIGNSTYQVISRILASGGRISLRKVQGILRLSQTYMR